MVRPLCWAAQFPPFVNRVIGDGKFDPGRARPTAESINEQLTIDKYCVLSRGPGPCIRNNILRFDGRHAGVTFCLEEWTGRDGHSLRDTGDDHDMHKKTEPAWILHSHKFNAYLVTLSKDFSAESSG